MATAKRNPAKPKKPATRTHVITTSAGNVRITEPATLPGRKKTGITVLVGEQARELNPMSGFVGFLRERAVVGVAIAFVVATQMQELAKQLIASFVDPMTKVLFSQNLSERVLKVHTGRNMAGKEQVVEFAWGQFVYQFIYFLFLIFVIYLIVRIFQLDKLDKKKD